MSETEVHHKKSKANSDLRNALLDLAKVVLPALIALAGQYITVVIPLQNQVKEQKLSSKETTKENNVGGDMDVALNNLYTITKFLHSKSLWNKLTNHQNAKSVEWDEQCANRALAVLKTLGLTASKPLQNMASGSLNDEYIVVECYSKNAFIMIMGITRKDDSIKKVDPLTRKVITGLELAYKGDLFTL